MTIKFRKPKHQGEIRLVKNGVLMFFKDDWEIVQVYK